MKLLIQIPCLNEEKNIKQTIDDLPKKISGISNIEIMIIDDGSDDKTSMIARECGAKYVINNKRNMGLGYSFQKGLEKAKELDVDFLINTDADNQYKGSGVETLVKTILEEKADIVIGCRNFDKIKHFSKIKRFLQKVGSLTIKKISGSDIKDASSGFRIYSRDAISKMRILSKFSYTMESLLQAEEKNLKISSVSIEVNPPTRKSRLFRNSLEFIIKQFQIIFKCFFIYKPILFFTIISLPFLFVSTIFISIFLYNFFLVGESGKVQSLILSSTLFITGIIILLLGFLGEMVKNLRQHIIEYLYKK